jgi:ammonia channel protein AmtB
LYCWIAVGQADPLMSARGAAVGFIAVSAGAPFFRPWSALATGFLAGALLPLGVYVVDRLMRLPDDTAAVSLGLVGGLIGLLVVPLLADGRWGQGWNGVGLDEYRNVLGLGVVGVLPARGFPSSARDGLGQLIAQLAGAGAIIVVGFLVGLLPFLLMQVPFYWRRRREGRHTRSGDPAPSGNSGEEDAGDFAPLELLTSHEPQPEPVSYATDVPGAHSEGS